MSEQVGRRTKRSIPSPGRGGGIKPWREAQRNPGKDHRNCNEPRRGDGTNHMSPSPLRGFHSGNLPNPGFAPLTPGFIPAPLRGYDADEMLEGNKPRDFMKRALAGALIGSLACFFYFFLFCNVLLPFPLTAEAFVLIGLAGALGGVMTSFFGCKLPGPPSEKE